MLPFNFKLNTMTIRNSEAFPDEVVFEDRSADWYYSIHSSRVLALLDALKTKLVPEDYIEEVKF